MLFLVLFNEKDIAMDAFSIYCVRVSFWTPSILEHLIKQLSGFQIFLSSVVLDLNIAVILMLSRATSEVIEYYPRLIITTLKEML